MSISCPKCQSDSVQNFPVAYESGISDLKTRSSGVSFGKAGLNFGMGKTKGVSQTALSKRTSPPRKLSYISPFLIGIVAALIVEILNLPAFVQYTVLGVVSAAFLYRAITFNRNQWPALLEAWRMSYICHKCGEVFEVKEIVSQSDM